MAHEKKLEELAHIIDVNGGAYDTLVKSYNVIPATSHEGKVAQAMFMAQNYPDFQTRFSKEVAHEFGYAELGFDIMGLVSGIGKFVGGIATSISNAVKAGKEKKAANKAEADKKAAEKKAAEEKAAAAAPKPEDTKKKLMIAGVVVFVLLLIGGGWYYSSKGKDKKEKK